MRFSSADESLHLELPLGIARYMRWRSTMAKGKETGGVLIGSYSADLTAAIVTRATAPPSDSRAGATWFERGTAGVDKLLEDAWSKGLHYLGEWHSHPGGEAIASSKDETQMRRIAADKLSRCSTPVLVILGGQSGEQEIAAYAQSSGSFLKLSAITGDGKNPVHPGARLTFRTLGAQYGAILPLGGDP
ncbi:MAG: Mov34/MPN/PAD-1 family protein [Candidatus Baltobacteraceae bacterium]